jgi:hypothetical protein
MADLYAKNEKALKALHDEIVEDIKTVLKEKGYTKYRVANFHDFEILSDRLLIDGSHTDNISTDDLLRYLRDAYHILPKFN